MVVGIATNWMTNRKYIPNPSRRIKFLKMAFGMSSADEKSDEDIVEINPKTNPVNKTEFEMKRALRWFLINKNAIEISWIPKAKVKKVLSELNSSIIKIYFLSPQSS